MPKIKTRDVVKGTVKTIDKSATAAERMKQAFVRTKDKAKHSAFAEENSPGEYAADRVSGGVDSAAREAVHQFDKQGRKGVKTTKENISKAKEYIQTRRAAADQPKKQARRKAAESVRRSAGGAKKTIKTVDRGGKTIKQTAKSTAKGTVKIARKTVKTAERTAKTTIKTTQQVAKAAQKTAQAAATTAKAAAKAAIAAVKAIIAGTKALISAIVAGGWVAVIVIIVICLIGLIAGSCFGIFFSGEDKGEGPTISQVISEINLEYSSKIEEIKRDTPHDDYEISGTAADWREVLAVYAVKTTTDPENAQEVATIDDSKKALLKDVFWQINEISSRTETKTETLIEESDDGHGNMVEKETTVTQIYLYISAEHRTADEMANMYGFTAEQKIQLAELLDDQFTVLWAQLIGGYSVGIGDIMIPDTDHIPTGIFSWPLPESFRISSPFGYRNDPFTGKRKFHSGLDIAAPAGTPILAAADGEVILANATDSWGGGYGYHVKVRHNNAFRTTYAHCSTICVVSGQRVKKGQVIAYVGTTGNSTGNHLHFEVWAGGERVDALNYFR